MKQLEFCIQHHRKTNHIEFYFNDMTGQFHCTTCEPPSTCQYPISGTRKCGSFIVPTTIYCLSHQVLCN